jgi:mannose-1-phosphate guanylyltransferase
LTIKAGKSISYQIHHHRSEVWTIVDGLGEFVLDGQRRTVQRGDVLNIPMEHFHAIRATTDLTLIEVQTGNPLIEEDIERFDWEW